jgi:phosphoribosylanthranilate isomerase
MTRLLIQVYEVQTPQEAEALIGLGVDHIGSVLTPEGAWRLPSLRDTISVVKTSGHKSCLIPLLGSPEAVLRVLDYYRPDIVHFCDAPAQGEGFSHACDRLIALQLRVKQYFPRMAIMRSVPVAPPGFAGRVPTLDFSSRLEPVSDYFLTDTFLVGEGPAKEGHQPVNGFIGITGRPCDWDMTGELVRRSKIPVIVAGGIGPENAAEALARSGAAGVDSCTQTNLRDALGRPIRFRKDLGRVQSLVASVRRTEIQLGLKRQRGT